MKTESFELESNKQNVFDTLIDDRIGRNESIWNFAQMCDSIDDHCSIALNGNWGSGKTFFVKQVGMVLNAYNEWSSELSESEKESIRKAFSKNEKRDKDFSGFQPQVCVYYDAWSADNDMDPILSLVYEILKDTGSGYTFNLDESLEDKTLELINLITNRDVKGFIEKCEGKKVLEVIAEQRDLHTLVNDFLASLLPEEGNRLIVFIDELDRCKPVFAVQLLERIKHYFTNDRVTFVFSVNMAELQHTVKCVYGVGFDAYSYLDRFFDLVFELPKIDMEYYLQSIGLENTSWVYESVCKKVVDHFGFEMREACKYIRVTKIAAGKIVHKHNTTFDIDEMFVFLVIVPILFGLKIYNIDEYNRFINGIYPDPLIRIMDNPDIAISACNSLLENDESYNESQNPSIEVVSLESKLLKAYEALFTSKGQDRWGNTNVGKCVFGNDTRDMMKSIISLLSHYAEY